MSTKLLLFFIILTFFSCSKEGNSNRLPNETKSGENTFGMLVDGKVWLPNTPSVFGFPNSTPTVEYNVNEGYFTIRAFRQNTASDGSIYLYSKFMSPGKYPIEFHRKANGDTLYCKDSSLFSPKPLELCENAFFIYDLEKSQLNITKLDTSLQIISGTFETILRNRKNEIIKISDGRFDSKFIKY